MRAQVLFPYGCLYCAPRRLHRSSQFLKLNLSRFSGGLLTAFFHMEVLIFTSLSPWNFASQRLS